MTEIKLEPNYGVLFAQFLREATIQAEHLTTQAGDIWTHSIMLRAAQKVLAPLNVAAQAITSVDDVQKFRDVLADAVTAIDTRATELEAIIGDAVNPNGFEELISTANEVVNMWSSGDLAGAVARLDNALQELQARDEDDEDEEEDDDDDDDDEPQPTEPEEGDWVTEDHCLFIQHNHPWKDRLTVPEGEDWREALKARMQKDNYWTHVWFVSDHGNWTLLNMEVSE